MRSELADLDRRHAIVEEEVPLGDRVIRLEKPRNFDDLVSEADFARDDRLPYWADLWQASRVLARLLITMPARAAVDPASAAPRDPTYRPRALELGCGLGLGTIAATLAGYAVTATDYYEDAMLFAARNTLRATGGEPLTRMVDWRDFPSDLGTFDFVFAADVLYEKIYAPLIAEAIHRTMAPGGFALVSDQGRIALPDFLAEAEQRGLTHRVIHREEPPEGVPGPSITVYELHRR